MRKFVVLTILAIFLIPLSDAILWSISKLFLQGKIILSGVDTWYIQYLALFIILFAGVSLVLWKFNKYLSIFTFLCLYSVIIPSGRSPLAILHLLQIDLSCLAIYIISKFNKRQRNLILKIILIMVFIQGIWIIIQALNIDPIFNSIKNSALDDTVGFSGSHNQIGLFFAVTLPLVIANFPYILPLSIFGLMKSTTSICVLAGICSSLAFSYFVFKKIFLIVLIISILSGMIFLYKYEVLNKKIIIERLEVIKYAVSYINKGKIEVSNYNKPNIIKIITCNRWFGYGLGNFISLFPYSNHNFVVKIGSASVGKVGYPTHVYNHAHNDYIEVLFEMGWTGLISLLLIIGDFFKNFFFSIKTKEIVIYFCCILAFLISALGIFPARVAVSAMWLILFFGLFQSALKEGKDGQTSYLGKRTT